MRAIYKPKGKAGEYAELACNLYAGCGHGCTYCYVPRNHHLMKLYGFENRQEFYNNPKPREGIIEALKKEAPKYKGKEVFLCFTCDPYQPINDRHQLTRQAIEILHSNEVIVNILTKGRIPDFDLLAKRPELSRVGVTLTHHSKQSPWTDDFEPYASRNYFRIWNLKNAAALGINTWASMEPVIHGSNILEIIKDTHLIVDEYKIGKWNYDKRADKIDWAKFATDAVQLLERLGCKYTIKEDLRRYLCLKD